MPRPSKKLTEIQIKSAKPKDAAYKLYDEEGLRLLVRPTGTKVWQYQYKLHDKWNIYTIGQYPEVGAAVAREMRNEARKLVQKGIPPVQQKIGHKLVENDPNSFGVIGREWLNKQIWVPKHKQNITRQLTSDIFNYIGTRSVRAITRQELVTVLQRIEERGALDVAKRTAQHIVQIFDFALLKGQCENNPAHGLSKIIRNIARQNRPYLKDAQLPEFLIKLEAYRGSELVKLAMKFLMHTFVRPGELRGARWEEFDLKKAEWRIPAHRMKMRRELIIPLSKQVIELYNQIQNISGKTDLLFPGNDATKPISDVTLTKCLIILGYGNGVATPHGMRSTASTILNENGFKPDVIERQLAHVPDNKIRAAYNHAEYLPERREMMQWWGDYLDRARK